MDWALLGEFAFGLILGGLVFWFIQAAARSDVELGRKAFRDGLLFNPAWNAEVQRGWKEERSEDERRKLQLLREEQRNVYK